MGWKLSRAAADRLLKRGGDQRPLEPDEVVPDIKQKRVDIKIGLDIAWLSSKRIVDRLVLVTGDSDFVPAMKFARREGVQVVLVTMQAQYLKDDLRVHADELREVSIEAP